MKTNTPNKADVAQRAIEVFLGGFSTNYIIDLISCARTIWFEKDGNLEAFEKSAP